MSIEDLFLPVFLVVGQPLDELQVEFVAALPNLARTVLPPAEQNDVMNNVPESVKLDELPGQTLTCLYCQYTNYTQTLFCTHAIHI